MSTTALYVRKLEQLFAVFTMMTQVILVITAKFLCTSSVATLE
jgi:hypothetical protein